ncbi:MAG: hypothetical protein MI863_28495 [Desulfobacterales bacterium]|nr:hypothetical protein [Desulfobacterales bacterium]
MSLENRAVILADDNTTRVRLLDGSDRPGSDDPGSDNLWIRTDELEGSTGFSLTPHGVCREDLCIPLPGGDEPAMVCSRRNRDWFNYSALARKTGQPVACDRSARVWSLGPVPAIRETTLGAGLAPDFKIKDRSGRLIRLSDFRGKKVLVTTWASW